MQISCVLYVVNFLHRSTVHNSQLSNLDYNKHMHYVISTPCIIVNYDH